MKKSTLIILSFFLIVGGLSGCRYLPNLPVFGATWEEVKVPGGNFSIECPGEQHLDNDPDSSLLLCRVAGADYAIIAFDVEATGDEAKDQQDAFDSADAYARASFSKTFISETVERNGRLVHEIAGLQKSYVPEQERNSLYHVINGEKALLFERTFYANGQNYTLSAAYEAPSDPSGYQQVLDTNKETRERFFNSFRFLEDKKATQ